jgi:hypothetical protein
MEKRTSERIKGRLKGKKDYRLLILKIEFGRRAR